jgi:hypothetical protein
MKVKTPFIALCARGHLGIVTDITIDGVYKGVYFFNHTKKWQSSESQKLASLDQTYLRGLSNFLLHEANERGAK